ncbi:unnamed protein product [Tilletia controversa]|nr:unnamed protein product [Tilletia controversa]
MAYAKTPVSLLLDCSKSKALVGRSAEEKETALTFGRSARPSMPQGIFISRGPTVARQGKLAMDEKLAMVEGPDSDNFLGCRAVATTNFATHAVEDFVLVTQVALDDLLWLSGLCTVIIQKVSQRALSAAEDEVKDLENDTEMVSVTSSAAQTGVEASTKPHRHFSITYERRFPGVVRRLLLFGDEVAVVNACPTTNLWTPSQIVKELANAPRLFTTVVSKDPADEP